jgi:hypothetical protein
MGIVTDLLAFSHRENGFRSILRYRCRSGVVGFITMEKKNAHRHFTRRIMMVFLLVFALWSALVGGASGWAGYCLGAYFLCSGRAESSARNVAVSCTYAVVLVGVAWYATCVWIAKNSSFDGAMIPSAILTVLCAPAAAAIAFLVAARLARRRRK